ncbi:MAG: bacillithiol biosynthesis cysteine-adding enzyme BshC [Candidatus Zixiibacteriota bacterium]|nr:MAG: bacillithiol biosynthesis cysteine-adding enzyme BshC [candidate division Zixibacteria bacterium]
MLEQTLAEMTGKTQNSIVPCERLRYSRLFLDHVVDKDPAASFFATRSVEDAAVQVDRVSFDRVKLSAILRNQNETYKAGKAAFQNIEKLKDERTLCVFAGQQAGLFGGPLLTLIKALGLAKSAGHLSKRLSRPVIPIFWIAGDDHDFEEANHTFVLDRKAELCRIAYETAPTSEFPTAEIQLSDEQELSRAKEQLRTCLGQTDFSDELYALIDRAYTPEDTLVTAFGKFMAHLTRNLGVVFFSPGDIEAKQHAAPLFKSIVQKQAEIHEKLKVRSAEIERGGYHLQVKKSENAAFLFYNLKGRKPVLRDGNSFVVGDTAFSEEELLAKIDEHPEHFSPDVLTRPLLQSYLFPTVSQHGGPAEIAYMAQLNPLFELLNMPAPFCRVRPSVTLVERHIEEQLSEYGIAFEELTDDIEQVINRVLAESFPPDLDHDFNALREAVQDKFDRFRDQALDFEPRLKDFARQTHGKIDYALKSFESKLFSAHKKKSQRTRERIYRLNNTLYPNRGLQERTLNITYSLVRHGLSVVDHLYDCLDSEETAHQLVSLTECK